MTPMEIDAAILRAITIPQWLETKVLARLVVDPDTGCHNWSGKISGDGYGGVGLPKSVGTYPSGQGIAASTHRIVMVADVGAPLKAGAQVGHVCHDVAAQRNECAGGSTCPHRRCAAHIEIQTQSENSLGGLVGGAMWVDGVRMCKKGLHPSNPLDRECRSCRKEGNDAAALRRYYIFKAAQKKLGLSRAQYFETYGYSLRVAEAILDS